jgi:diketogulonate reductase-like aldo/keto reductase
MYLNEDSVGAGIAASDVPRSELYITTKLATIPAGLIARDMLVDSLKKLGLEYVDLFLIHVPQHHDLKVVWKQMEELKKKGLARSIGVSDFKPDHLKEILKVASIPPAANQVHIHALLA